MSLHPRLTRDTVALVKRFERFQPVAEPTPQGGWSVGYGHTLTARAESRVSRADAEALLVYDLDGAARAVERALFAPVTQRQFEALTALCFNLGEAAFVRSSTLARTNAGAELEAADEIERWRQAELGAGMQVVDALVRRRAAEKAHFLGLPEGGSSWPSALLQALPAAGGDIAEPVVETASPPPAALTAALTAANGVEARLRRLFPEDQPAGVPTSARAAASATTFEVEAPGFPIEPPPTLLEPSGIETAPAPGAPDLEIAWEPTPPPFDPPAAVRPQGAEPAPAIGGQPAVGPSETLVATHAEPVPTVSPDDRRGGRWAPVMLTLVGAILFAGAAMLILAGRPSLFDLGLGIAGVIIAAPGLYGLLGGARPDPAAQRKGAPTAAPFHRDGAHTK